MRPWIDWSEWDAAAGAVEKEIIDLRGAIQTNQDTSLGGAELLRRTAEHVESTAKAIAESRTAIAGIVEYRRRELRRVAAERWNRGLRVRWLKLRAMWPSLGARK